jgi:HlyD family secretion protein
MTQRYHSTSDPDRRSVLRPLAHLATAVCVVLALWGCSNQADPAAQYDRLVVRKGTFEVTLEEAGTVQATRVESIILPMSGRLIYLPSTGTPVKQGDIIVQLETQQAEETLEQRLNELKSLEAELQSTIESLQVALRENTLNRDLAESELEFSTLRLQDVKVRLAETEVLLERAVVPEDDLREASYNVDSTRMSTVTTDLALRSQIATGVQERSDRMSAISRAELQGRRALRFLLRAQDDLQQATIRAPINGIFLRTSRWDWQSRSMREPQPGEEVLRRQEVGQIPDLDSLIVRTQIPESYLLRVSKGKPATVSFDAHDGLHSTGVVKSIGNVAINREESAGGAIVQTDQASGQKVFEVEVALDEVDPRLRPGITAQVKFVLERHEDVITVPIRAVRTDGADSRVAVLRPDGKVEQRTVTLGMHNEMDVIVLDGLSAGEVVGLPRQLIGNPST